MRHFIEHFNSKKCFTFDFLVSQVDEFASRTKTVVGHNLEPTPWHLFPPNSFSEQPRYARVSKILQCSYLKCRRRRSNQILERGPWKSSNRVGKCPRFFSRIGHDLKPWVHSGISLSSVMEAQKFAAFRAVIVGGKLYVEFYYACVQSRAMFTVWGLLQLLRRYPGMVPDVDLMFDCMDRPTISRNENGQKPLPLFRYCTTKDHFDIPFPDWSFWGW